MPRTSWRSSRRSKTTRTCKTSIPISTSPTKSSSKCRILGVDPGLRCTGYGVITVSGGRNGAPDMELVEMGVIRTAPGEGIAARLGRIHGALTDVVRELEPDVIVLEKLYSHYKHPATAILMGHARGVVCLVSGTEGVPLTSLPSTHVKKSVTGRGHASKEQVQRMVQHLLCLKSVPEPCDAADALAVAITYARTLKKGRQ